MTRRSWALGAFCLSMLFSACASSAPVRSRDRAPSGAAAGAEHRLVALEARVMAADYRADLDELARLRDEILPLAEDPAAGYLAHYWAGFASWRWAINGVSRGKGREELASHLATAAADFDAAIGLRDDFADGYAAAASVRGWLAAFQGNDAAALRALVERSRQQLTRARELAPDNPRVLWVLGGVYLFAPPSAGGDPQRAVEIYRRMLEVTAAAAPPEAAVSPLPDWGRPEALMSLAYAHLNQPAPDLASAAEEARAALRLQPGWFYVREILLPQIEEARRKAAGPEPPAQPRP
jgi:hypothetical protein